MSKRNTLILGLFFCVVFIVLLINLKYNPGSPEVNCTGEECNIEIQIPSGEFSFNNGTINHPEFNSAWQVIVFGEQATIQYQKKGKKTEDKGTFDLGKNKAIWNDIIAVKQVFDDQTVDKRKTCMADEPIVKFNYRGFSDDPEVIDFYNLCADDAHDNKIISKLLDKLEIILQENLDQQAAF